VAAEHSDFIYARVSTRKQLDDLQTQVARLAAKHPGARIIKDIGSGLNFRRKGLLSLLELALAGRVQAVHVAHRDRLCRFAFDLVQHILQRHGASVVVDAHGADAADSSPETELINNFLSVITVFGAWLYGRRSAGGRKRQRGAVETALEEGEDLHLKREAQGVCAAAPAARLAAHSENRMLPTAEQRRELERHFAAARWAYNAAVEGVQRMGATPNFINLRNGVLPARPEFARGVHNKFRARAVKQAADAFQTNFARMRKSGIGHKFRVQFRSFKKSPSEGLVVERGKEGPFRRFEAMAAPVSAKRRDTARAECTALFGVDLGKVGGIRLQDKPHIIQGLITEGQLSEDAKILWDKRSRSFHLEHTYEIPALPDPSPDFSDKRCLSADLGVKPVVQWY
jgi:predicted site-specific integrase-resolvase